MKTKDLVVGNLYKKSACEPWYFVYYLEEEVRTKTWGKVEEIPDGAESYLLFLGKLIIPVVRDKKKRKWTWYKFFSMNHKRNILVEPSLVKQFLSPIYPGGDRGGSV